MAAASLMMCVVIVVTLLPLWLAQRISSARGSGRRTAFLQTPAAAFLPEDGSAVSITQIHHQLGDRVDRHSASLLLERWTHTGQVKITISGAEVFLARNLSEIVPIA